MKTKLFRIDWEDPADLHLGLVSGFGWRTNYVLAESADGARALLKEYLEQHYKFKNVSMGDPEEIILDLMRVLE